MTEYNAHYRTDGEYALYHFEADSPEEALQLARELYDNNAQALQFSPYDGGFMPLDEIEISGDAGDQLAVWQSDDMRLRLAARELLAALEYCERVLRDHEQYDDEGDSAESEAAHRARAAIANAKPSTYTQNSSTTQDKEVKTMSDDKKQPSHKAFAVENFQKDDKEKSHWTEIGAAWAHKDGKGFDLNIKLVPLSGRIVLREKTSET